MTTANEINLEHWQELLKTSQADTKSWGTYHEENQKRVGPRDQMLALLRRYLAGQCGTEDLRGEFDRKTRREWDVFGFKGTSGAMFLNMLVKHVPDAEALANRLREVLAVPQDEKQGQTRMGTFLEYLQGLIAGGTVAKSQLQPARTPFFVSAWWHLQNIEQWPVFYISGRRVLQREGLYVESQDPVEDYFCFRRSFMALAAALHLQSWDTEHMLDWHNRFPGESGGGGGGASGAGGGGEDGGNGDDTPPGEDLSHTHVQWLLGKIGQKLGCKVWIAANDQSKTWDGQSLGDLSIKTLPTLGLDEESQKVIRMIDVVWLKGTHQVAAAFEIEHTTSIYSGLLRMSDLVTLSPNLSFPLYLVAPEARLEQVRTQLRRPTFQTLDLHNRCGFFACETLVKESDGILRWASDPSAIDRLASKVEDVKG